MLEVMPAIDLRGGRCVRLFQGDYTRETVFGDDPVAMAARWESLGATRIHIVDLDGARAGFPVQLPLIERMIEAVKVPVQLGGGIRQPGDVEAALKAGVERVVLGTAAIGDNYDDRAYQFRRQCLESFRGRVVMGLDAREGRLAVRGWTETTIRDAFEFAEQVRAEGFAWVIYTDIGRDATLQGPNLEHLRRLIAMDGLQVIASGGISSVDDLEEVAAAGAAGAIVGLALYTGAIELPTALSQLRQAQQA